MAAAVILGLVVLRLPIVPWPKTKYETRRILFLQDNYISHTTIPFFMPIDREATSIPVRRLSLEADFRDPLRKAIF